MSQANAVATFGKLLQDKAADAATVVGLAGLDTDIFSPFSEPYPSLRLHLLGDGHEKGEGWDLVQVSLRTPIFSVEEWLDMRFRRELVKGLGFSYLHQKPDETLADQLDFESSDTPAVSGHIRLQLVNSQIWKVRPSAEVRHSTAQFYVYYQGDS